LAGGAAALAAGAAAFGPICRHVAEQAAGRYGATVTIARVRPTLQGVRFEDVAVTLPEVRGVAIHFDRVEAKLGRAGRRIVLREGRVTAIGARDALRADLEAWRSRRSSGEAPSAAQRSTASHVELEGLDVSWANAAESPTESVVALGVRVERDGEVAHFSTARATVAARGSSVVVLDGRIDIQQRNGASRVAGLGAASVVADLVVPVAAPAATPKLPVVDQPAAEPAREPQGSRGKVRRLQAERVKERPEPRDAKGAVVSEPSRDALRAATAASGIYRAALVDLAKLVEGAIVPGATIRLGGLRAKVRRGSESLNLGPGTLLIEAGGGILVVELVHGGADADGPQGAPPAIPADEVLTFRLAIPLGSDPHEVAADVRGGPIWLSALGVREGDFGLFDVSHTSLTTRSHLVLSADGRTLAVDGDAKIHGLSLQSAALSDEAVAGLEVAVQLRASADLDGGRISVAQGELDLGAIRVLGHADYERTPVGQHLRAAFDMPITACQAMLDSMPKGLVPKLQGMRLAGSYAVRGHADIDTANFDRGFGLDWDAANTCRVVEAPAALAVERFRAPFRRTAYDGEGRAVSLETGPGTAEWVAGSAISKFMEVAVLTTEDGGFRRHHGFDHEAIRNSVRENLRRRRFVRGASTISMQLAKNLYLDRGKNLSRKLQEAVLTMYLEQELTKEQILELYFNVVEFGPMVYGIGPAARYYYNTDAHSLSLGQALYISSIMPNPKLQHFGEGGAVSMSWMSYLRKLMKLARGHDLVTEEELEEGLRETVVRGSPTPLRSAKPMNGPEGEEPIDPVDPMDMVQPF
jgi:hypothetical protein